MNALTPALLAETGLSSAAAPTGQRKWPVNLFPPGQHPRGLDAALIEACEAYPAAFNRYCGESRADGDTADAAYDEVCSAVDANPPQTWEGLLAKAMTGRHDMGAFAERWREEIGADLLRLLEAGKLPAMLLPASLDDELIAACERHPGLTAAYNAHLEKSKAAWNNKGKAAKAYFANRKVISEARPQTLAGIIAKAKAAKQDAIGPDGEEQDQGFHQDAGEWAWDLVGDLLDLDHANGVYARHPELVVSADADLIQAEAAYRAIDDGPLTELCRIDDRGFTAQQDAELDAKKIVLIDEQDPHLLTLASTPAMTIEGMRAKARSLRGLLGSTRPDPEPKLGSVTSNDVLRSLLRDLLGAGGEARA